MIRILLILSVLFGGCTVTAWLEDGSPRDDDDSAGDDDDSAGDDDDSAGDDDDSAGDDDDSAVVGCRLPVPDHVTLQHPVQGDTLVPFYVPTMGWALAVLHASRQVDDLALQDVDLRLSPSYFLALSLETGTFGCSEDIPPSPVDSAVQWARRSETDPRGCLDVSEGSVWLDLCRMYPGDLPCPDGYSDVIPSTEQAMTGRDNVEPSVLAVARYAVYGYAMLAFPGGADLDEVDDWLGAVADPQAVEKLLAYMHWQTPFVPAFADVVEDCATGPLDDCLPEPAWVVDRAVAVGAHTAQLEAEAATSCFDRPLSAAAVDDYVDAIAVLFPAADVAAGRAAAQQALTDAGGDGTSFQVAADAVLDALDEGMGLRLRCPGTNLTSFYGVSCP